MDCYICKLIINSTKQGLTQDFILVMVAVAVGGREGEELRIRTAADNFLGRCNKCCL